MDENDAHHAIDGSKISKEIAAQYAIISSAQELINRLIQEKETVKGLQIGGWVYSMKDLEEWIKLFTHQEGID